MNSLKLNHGGMTMAQVPDTQSDLKKIIHNASSHHGNESQDSRHRHESNGKENCCRHNHEKKQCQKSRTEALTNDVPLSQFGNEVNPYSFEVLSEIAHFILDRVDIRPKVAVICGSGLGNLAHELENKAEFPYEEIPHFPVSTVAGHAGKLIVGHLAGVPIFCMQGRFHYYEGYPLWKCAMPIRVLKLMGVEILIVTNAAGGVNAEYKVGDVMLIKDHINFPGFAGLHPLVGPNDDTFGPRFPPMNTAYDKQLRTLAKHVSAELGMSDFMREGVYAMLGGPSFETAAELRLLRFLGVDAVGMSTVPEVVTARHCGMRVLAFSLITNEAITDDDADDEASHEEVVETGQRRQEDLKRFMTFLVPCIQREIIP